MSTNIKTTELSWDEISSSEYCSLFEEDRLGRVVITYDAGRLADIRSRLPHTGLGYDLSANVSELFDVRYFDKDDQEIEPSCHGDYKATIEMRWGLTVPCVEIRSESEYSADDWACIVFKPEEPDEKQDTSQGFFVTVTQRSPSGAEHDVNALIVGPKNLTGEMVERVALNLVTDSDTLHRAPEEDYGDNVFVDCEGFSDGHAFWIVSIKAAPVEHLAILQQYTSTAKYETLLQHGEVDIR